MFWQTRYLVIILIALLVIQSGLLVFLFFGFSMQDQPTVHHYAYLQQPDFFEEAFREAEPEIIMPQSRVIGGILPHHLLVKDKIAAWFSGVRQFRYETVVLIGPNHLGRGTAPIMTSAWSWRTPYGVMQPDQEVIEGLIQTGLVNIEEPPFNDEHSIYNLIAFIHRTWPRAEIVPIILKTTVTSQESQRLAEVLNQILDQDSVLVLASVDFSHELPTAISDQHDQMSARAILDFDLDQIYSLHLDSPASIYTLLSYLRQRQMTSGQLLFSTNSGRLLGDEDGPTTSHQLFYF